ncbi:MAG TPA: TIGR00269 family protein [Methanoregula sp.]|nr:TIGR00269 family protein [Methanoregula sp.]
MFRDRETGRELCAAHLKDGLEARVRETIRNHSMIRDGDRIAVALSGGKDSTALLLLLHAVLPAKDVSLVAVTVDEGIAGYRDETIGAAVRLAAELGVEHRIVTFSGLFGGTLDAFLRGREARACTVCGILRKKAIAVAAKEAGADRLATGHNLDDEAQSVLMNALRGDLPRLVRESGEETGYFIPRIKPLREIAEKEIAVYLVTQGRWTELPECPYTQSALRAEVRSLLSGFEYRHPGTMKRLIQSREIIRTSIRPGATASPVRRCTNCGDPCSGELCQVCALLPSLRAGDGQRHA